MKIVVLDGYNKNPGDAPPGFSLPFAMTAYSIRLVTDYLSLSSHLQMRWLITPATAAIIRDVTISILGTPFLSPV